MDLGLAPRPLFGVKFDAGFRRGWFSLVGEFRWDPTASGNVQNAGAGNVDVSTTLLAGGLVGCAHYDWHVSFAGCVVGELGQLQSSFGRNDRDDYAGFRHAVLYAGGGVGARAEIPLPARLYLHVAADMRGVRKLASTSGGAGQTLSAGSVAGLAGGIGAGLGAAF